MTIIGKIDSEVFLKSYPNGGEETFIQNFRFFSAKTSTAGPLVTDGEHARGASGNAPTSHEGVDHIALPVRDKKWIHVHGHLSASFHL